MKNYIALIFVFFFSTNSFAGLSAARGPQESFAQARDRAIKLRSKVSDDTAEDLKGPLSSLDLKAVPELPDLTSLNASYEFARNNRFIKTTNGFLRRITWLYPDDGCYARAELASQIIQEKNYPPPAKIFAFGNLWAQSDNSPSGGVSWWYHVAIGYRVKDTVYVLDPALESKQPLTLQNWGERIGMKRARVNFTLCSAQAFDPGSECQGAPNVDRNYALREQGAFLSPEWSRVKQLGHDPNMYLGDQPPWLQP